MTAYFIDAEFNEFEFEVFTKEQIRDTFISAVRSISYDDDGVSVLMGASDAIDGITCISAAVFSDYCTVELFKEADDRVPVKAKNVSLEDAMRAFYEFFNGVLPALDVMQEQKDVFTMDTDFTDYPIPVRDREQIEDIISIMPELEAEEGCCCDCEEEDEECDCDDECCDDECCCETDAPFIVLQAPEPIKGVDYIQAMYVGGWWYVELSYCSRKRVNFGCFFEEDAEVIRIFNEFMDGNVPDTDGWKKVKI